MVIKEVSRDYPPNSDRHKQLRQIFQRIIRLAQIVQIQRLQNALRKLLPQLSPVVPSINPQKITCPASNSFQSSYFYTSTKTRKFSRLKIKKPPLQAKIEFSFV